MDCNKYPLHSFSYFPLGVPLPFDLVAVGLLWKILGVVRWWMGSRRRRERRTRSIYTRFPQLLFFPFFFNIVLFVLLFLFRLISKPRMVCCGTEANLNRRGYATPLRRERERERYSDGNRETSSLGQFEFTGLTRPGPDVEQGDESISLNHHSRPSGLRLIVVERRTIGWDRIATA